VKEPTAAKVVEVESATARVVLSNVADAAVV
jgi:hypothetical protein